MNILSIGTDARVFEKGSTTRVRQEAYTKRFNQMNIIVPTTKYSTGVSEGNLNIYPAISTAGFFSKFWARVNVAICVSGVLGRSKIDVVTVQDPFETGLLALIGMWGYKIPLHVQVHTDFLSPEFARHSFANRIRTWIAPSVLRRASRIRVILEKTKDELIARGFTAPITVLPIFVDVAKYATIQRTKHPRFKIALLVVARLESEKNVTLAIDALYAAREAGHDAGLTLVGAGREEKPLREYARVRGLERFVEFAGTQDDLAPYLGAADIMLVPSKYEGYGLVIVEALAAGVPVLSTDVGVAREAGAIVASEKEFPHALVEWIAHGPRKASLTSYPYIDFASYVQAYADDIKACSK